MTNYIYLLQVREFVKTNENIYKVGMTKKENYERFNQYPKGSILLFQMICNNCNNIEKCVLKIFKEKFKQRKDIGNEYFEGDYREMIDIIYLDIKNEGCENLVEDTEEEDNEEEYIEEESEEDIEEKEDSEEHIYEITSYEEWIKFNKIDRIIINNKKEEGYIKIKGQLWRKLYDKNRLDFDKNYMEHLMGYIEYIQDPVYKMVKPIEQLVDFNEMNELMYYYVNKLTNNKISNEEYIKLSYDDKKEYTLNTRRNYKFIRTSYNINKILQDTVKKCYIKTVDYYILDYHEYILYDNSETIDKYVIFNSLNLSYIPIDELINNKILTEDKMGINPIYINNMIDISIVDNILDSLIKDETKKLYKKLVYNLIVKQEEKQIIFYDYNECLLTTWIRDLLGFFSNHNYIYLSEYYKNKSEFKKTIQKHRPRCAIIANYNKVSIEKQIEDVYKIGIKIIIVCQDNKTNNMYNIINFRKYLQDNKETLMECIKNETNNKSRIFNWEVDIEHDDSIFYSNRLFLTNFFKWCCVK